MKRVEMKRAALSILVWVVMAAALLGQDPPATIYAESFRQGAIHITEETFEAKLTPDNPTYRERIKDSAGNDRYEMTVAPLVLEGGSQVTSWKVALKDLHHSIYSNVLLADQVPSADPKNNLWWLNPNRFSAVPIRARRIMKVDGFYVVIQVKDLHFTPLDSPYLDSMNVQFAFSTRDPRSNH
jgi:hypothetical protein